MSWVTLTRLQVVDVADGCRLDHCLGHSSRAMACPELVTTTPDTSFSSSMPLLGPRPPEKGSENKPTKKPGAVSEKSAPRNNVVVWIKVFGGQARG